MTEKTLLFLNSEYANGFHLQPEEKDMRHQHIHRPIILLLFLSSLFFWGCSGNSLTFLVRFPEVSGLKQDDHVYFGKNEIGQVEKVTYTTQGDYLVAVKIVPEFKNAATEDSLFYIGHAPANESAMAVIVEQERPGGVTLKNGITVQGSARSGYLDDILNELKEKAEKAEKDLNEALGELKKSLDATSEKLDRNLETTIENLSRQLNSFTDELGKLPDSQEVDRMEESFRQFRDEFQKAQKDVQDHIRNEILPRFRAELEQLRKQFKKEGREQELEKIDKQVKDLEMV
ncbi:MlaD family protein [Desulfogranum mediterraneum]|uniref:hypothetical protein n=1 Tax=Desulfogranum mediterraneum TaxID=160661 RepID=UPI001294703A|nr:hypothetical protein [Desulfogranum mediterraneum]